MYYLRLYLYATLEQFFSIIKTGHLRLSRFSYTNDVTEAIPRGNTEPPPKVKNHGFICFSATYSDPTLWGFYSDRGRGVCLAFDLPVTPDENDDHLFRLEHRLHTKDDLPTPESDLSLCKVKYSQERPEDINPAELLYTKNSSWSHEKEYRVIFDLTEDNGIDCELVNNRVIFHHAGIMRYFTALILGVECTLEITEAFHLLKKYSQRTIPVSKIYRHHTTFALEPAPPLPPLTA